MIKCCCKCEERHVGCHAKCETYIAEKKKHDEEKAIITKHQQIYGAMQEYKRDKYFRLASK